MAFRAVKVYDFEDEFIGFSIKADGAVRLYTHNLWKATEDELADLNAQLATLNDSISIREQWPDVRDPEVQKLLADPTFEPPEMISTQVIDEELSNVVFENREGEFDIDDPARPIDYEKSDLVMKEITVPSPASTGMRIRAACEQVALARAEQARTA